MRTANNALFLFAGVLLGWFSHSLLYPEGPAPSPATISVDAGPPQLDRNNRQSELPAVQLIESQSDDSPGPDTTAEHFRLLLEQQDFTTAVAYYEEMVGQDDKYQAQLNAILENYAGNCLRLCEPATFVALADTWLASYYDDISMILLLAQYQWQQGYSEEAVNAINLAKTYAYTPGQQTRVQQALVQLVQATDKHLSAQHRWIELLGFYEFVEALALSQPDFRERQDWIYREIGEIEVEQQPEQVPANAVPLTRRGDHYLVRATLNDRHQVTLMIDTGASVTSLSRSSFTRLGRSGFTLQGTRLFNTANGLARGNVYRADSLALGDAFTSNTDVAILDYEPSGEVDGLLGMNVLRNFAFEIDQDRALLLMRAR